MIFDQPLFACFFLIFYLFTFCGAFRFCLALFCLIVVCREIRRTDPASCRENYERGTDFHIQADRLCEKRDP